MLPCGLRIKKVPEYNLRIPGRIIILTRGTTRIDKPPSPTRCFTALPTLTLNACNVPPYYNNMYPIFSVQASSLSGSDDLLRSVPSPYFPQTALSVGDAVFLSFSVWRVSFNAFFIIIVYHNKNKNATAAQIVLKKIQYPNRIGCIFRLRLIISSNILCVAKTKNQHKDKR